MDVKVCSKCGRELPIEEFYKAKTNKDGHMNVCKECFIQQKKQYCQDNRDVILEKKKQYYQGNKEQFKQYYQDNKEDFIEYQKLYRQTPIGRALNLVSTYKQSDKKYGRGECTLTADWVVENIFSQQCACGETDWHKLGCDRIDNDKPHTPDNVEPCCTECNKKRARSKHTRKITD